MDKVELEHENHCQVLAQKESEFSNKMHQVKADLSSVQKGVLKNNNDLRQAILSDFNAIKSDLLRQKRNREEFYENLINKLVSDTLHLKEVITDEKRERQETHNEVIKAIKSMRSKFISINEVAFLNPARNQKKTARSA